MRVKLSDLAPFEKICHKICLNIPDSYHWRWDQQRKMAVVVLDEEDAELVFFPLFKEFKHHWNFSTPAETARSITDFINTEFGLMPGQAFFTSHTLCDIVLCVAWWPWGNDDRVSMRVGLIPVNHKKLADGMARQCLSRWLDICAADAGAA